MRPTDENQPDSTRPNLMSSSRRSGGEDNIFAMLERDGGRGRSRQLSPAARVAWFTAAGALAAVLVGVLAWLAWENSTASRALPASITVIAPAPAPQAVPVQAAPAPVMPAQAAEIEPPVQGAAIIDSPAPPTDESVMQPAPAMPAAAAAPQPPAADTKAQVADDDAPPPLVLLPPEESAPPPAVEPPPAPAVTTPVPKVARALPAKPKTAAARTHKAARTAAASRTARKPQAAAAQPQAADAQADSDVALISAILMHSGERAQAEAAACSGDACPPKPAAKP